MRRSSDERTHANDGDGERIAHREVNSRRVVNGQGHAARSTRGASGTVAKNEGHTARSTRGASMEGAEGIWAKRGRRPATGQACARGSCVAEALVPCEFPTKGAFPLARGSGVFPLARGSGVFPLARGSGAFPLANGWGAYPQSQRLRVARTRVPHVGRAWLRRTQQFRNARPSLFLTTSSVVEGLTPRRPPPTSPV